jgi:hypothetical protein
VHAEATARQVPDVNVLFDQMLDSFPLEGLLILGMNPLGDAGKLTLQQYNKHIIQTSRQ